MAIISKEAGPEWAYCAGLSDKKFTKVEFDYLYVNVERQGDEPANIIDSLQALSSETGMYVPSSVLRFSFDKLKGLIGPDSDGFDLFFQAFDGADEVPIPDGQSFRRLLVAIGLLGLPQPVAVDDHPPVLRFLARLKDFPDTVTITIDDQPAVPKRKRNKLPAHLLESPEESPEEGPTRPKRTPVQEDIRAGPSKSSSLAVPVHTDVLDEPDDSSFLLHEEPEQELTLEERVEQDLDYGFSGRDGVHDENIHNLYADIAGISRDMRDPENPRHEYKPPYSNVSLPPHQTYPTGWMLSDRSRILHYLADKPGTGKTFAACEAMIRIMMILSNGIAIEDELANLSSLRDRPIHMHDEENARWGRNTQCRANTLSKWGFTCQCDEKSPLYEVTKGGYFAAGFMLVMVPLDLVGQWFTEISRFIRSSTRLPHNQKPIEIINIRGLQGSPGENLKDFFYGQREHHGLGTICIVPTTTTVSRSLKEFGQNPRALKQQCSIVVLDEIQKIKTVGHESVGLVRSLIDLAQYPVHVLALSGSAMTTGPNDFNVVQSIALHKVGFEGWHGEEEYKEYEERLLTARSNLDEYAKQVDKAGIVGRGRRGGLPEEEREESHGLMKAYDQRCREYAIVVPLLQRKALDNYLGYRIPKLQPEAEIAQIIRCDSSMNNVQKMVANDYKQYLRYRYQHRVRVWSRKPQSTRGPKPKLREVLFNLDARQAPIPQDAPVTTSSITEASLIGFAPGLAKSILKRTVGSQQFRSSEANAIFSGTTTTTQRQAVRNSPFWSRAEAAFQKVDEETGEVVLHPKIRTICRIIDEMLADKEEHANGPQKRFGVLPKKAVICVPHAWHGFILIAYLFQRYPNRNFTYVGAGNKLEERETLIAPFRRRTDVKDPSDGTSNDPIALIGTYRIIGTGHNLTRCNYAIATAPLGSMGDQVQFFARINRKGQYATTHTYVLVDQGNPVDVCTYHRLQRRTALTVPEDEMGQPGLKFLLEDIDVEENQEIDPSFESGAEASGSE